MWKKIIINFIWIDIGKKCILNPNFSWIYPYFAARLFQKQICNGMYFLTIDPYLRLNPY